jgi:hypothetical protein
MRKLSTILSTVSAVTLLALAAACSDAPTAAPSLRPSAPSAAIGTSITIGDTTITTFTVDPLANEQFVEAGVFKLKLVANSICNPALSTYGVGEWDKGCITLTTPLTITARSYTVNGQSVVKFSPDLRFAPDKINTLQLWKNTNAAAIAWCPTGSTRCYDEARTDPSVASTIGTNGFISRRVKHFSGYTTTWGFDDDGSTEGGETPPTGIY